MSPYQKSLTFVICLLAILQSCDSRESLVKEQLVKKITDESNSTIKLESFKKTNGYDQTVLGTKMYVLEWTAEVFTTKTLWKMSPNKFNPFYWSNFRTTTTNPELTQGTFRLPYQHLEEGAKIRLTGRTGLQETDNGWRTSQPNVLSSEVISGLLNRQ